MFNKLSTLCYTEKKIRRNGITHVTNVIGKGRSKILSLQIRTESKSFLRILMNGKAAGQERITADMVKKTWGPKK